MGRWLYRYIFRGIGIAFLIGVITSLILMINHIRQLQSPPKPPAVHTGTRR